MESNIRTDNRGISELVAIFLKLFIYFWIFLILFFIYLKHTLPSMDN